MCPVVAHVEKEAEMETKRKRHREMETAVREEMEREARAEGDRGYVNQCLFHETVSFFSATCNHQHTAEQLASGQCLET